MEPMLVALAVVVAIQGLALAAVALRSTGRAADIAQSAVDGMYMRPRRAPAARPAIPVAAPERARRPPGEPLDSPLYQDVEG